MFKGPGFKTYTRPPPPPAAVNKNNNNKPNKMSSSSNSNDHLSSYRVSDIVDPEPNLVSLAPKPPLPDGCFSF